MYRLIASVCLLPAAMQAQYLIDPVKGAQAWHSLEPVAGEQPMRCQVIAIRPAISFSFRLQSGYVMNVPIQEYAGKEHIWAILLRVKSVEGEGKPVYLGANFAVPKLPEKSKDSLSFSGVFLLGEGQYDVDMVGVDDSNRICRKSWQVKATASKDEQKMRSMLPRNRIEPLTFSPPRKKEGTPTMRLTVLLHAAPSFPRSTQLRGRDRARLLGSLASLLEQLPAASIRLVAFNLDQKRELFRTDNFDDQAFRRLADSLAQLDLGVVDIKTLNNRTGHIDLLADLIDAELNASAPPDAVVFLGPVGLNSGRVPTDKNSDAPKFFYFQFRPMRERPGPPDLIESATKAVGGKTIPIHTPNEFAKAIDALQKYLEKGR